MIFNVHYIVIHICNSVIEVILHGKESVQVFGVFYTLYVHSVLMLEIQLSRGKRWHAINHFNHDIFFVPVINAVSQVLFFLFQLIEVTGGCLFVDSNGIVDHHF